MFQSTIKRNLAQVNDAICVNSKQSYLCREALKCWTAMASMSSVDFSKTKGGLQAFGRAVLLTTCTQAQLSSQNTVTLVVLQVCHCL